MGNVDREEDVLLDGMVRSAAPGRIVGQCASGHISTGQDLPAANQSTRALIKLWRRISLPRLSDGQCQQRRGCSFERNGEKCSPWPDYYSCASGRTLTSQDLPACYSSIPSTINLFHGCSPIISSGIRRTECPTVRRRRIPRTSSASVRQSHPKLQPHRTGTPALHLRATFMSGVRV